MLFNSLTFAVFLPVVFLLYWRAVGGNTRRQNLLLLAASYVFYGWWDWRFLSLILFSSSIDFLVGRRLGAASVARTRKRLLLVSLTANLGVLGFFKYFNFFAESAENLLEVLGLQADIITLNVILPVGISFYTFQTLSYAIDVYRRKITPIDDPVPFFAYVSFFPQLVAGPIERASNLLPQFELKGRASSMPQTPSTAYGKSSGVSSRKLLWRTRAPSTWTKSSQTIRVCHPMCSYWAPSISLSRSTGTSQDTLTSLSALPVSSALDS